MRKIILFDLDGTLIDNPSSEKSYIFWLIVTLRLGPKQYYATIKYVFRWLLHLKKLIFVRNKAYLAELPVEKTAREAKQFATVKLFPRIRPKIKKIFDQHRKNGDHIVLLTGSPEFIAEIFAKHLGADEIEATVIDQKDGYFTDKIPKQHPYGRDKLTIAKKICAKHNTTIDQAVAYANSIHDQFLMNAVGEAIAVTPDWRLRRLAQKKGWKIYGSTNQTK